MLIAYSITVIVVTLLVSRIENRLVILFRGIFPKVLIPIALFQVIASVLLLTETGVTFGRYYVILYGAFAVFSGIVLSVRPAGRSGIIALALIFLSAVSLIPPVDAFTVSRGSQIAALESTLEKNGMLQGGVIMPKGDIPDADKTKIIASIRYLSETDELGKVEWLPEGFYAYEDNAFFKAFGFYMDEPIPGSGYVSVYLDKAGALPVGGYDIFAQIAVPFVGLTEVTAGVFELNGETYELFVDTGGNDDAIAVRDNAGRELIRFDSGEIYARYASYPNDKNLLTLDEATFVTENETAALKFIVLNAGFSRSEISNANAQMYAFVKIK